MRADGGRPRTRARGEFWNVPNVPFRCQYKPHARVLKDTRPTSQEQISKLPSLSLYPGGKLANSIATRMSGQSSSAQLGLEGSYRLLYFLRLWLSLSPPRSLLPKLEPSDHAKHRRLWPRRSFYWSPSRIHGRLLPRRPLVLFVGAHLEYNAVAIAVCRRRPS